MEGRTGTYNQWVIDNLMEDDVPVIDMYDKIYKGTFLGGNLTTALKNKTKNPNGGAVIWGGVRDVEQMKKVENTQVYYRGIDPTPIRDFVMTGYNTVTRIGNAVCLPGDVVFGAGGGVLFIPSHLVEEVVGGAAKTQVKDMFGFEMIAQNKFTTAQIDKTHGAGKCSTCFWTSSKRMTVLRHTEDWTGRMNMTLRSTAIPRTRSRRYKPLRNSI